MQKRKLMISILAAISVTVSTTFGVMALNASAPDASKAAAEQLEVTTVPAPTTAVAEPAIERIVDLSVDKAEASGSEGDVITLKTKANTNEKITYRSTDKKIATVSSNGVVSLKSKGNAKIIAEADGEKAVCKVNVKEFVGNNIKKNTMSNIASEIGCQVDYAYPESTIMCSAYSFAYAYYQVKGTSITPGSVWTGGGCNWAGGTVHNHGSAEDMLSTIKSELDHNRACVGLLSFGSASTHYVTFYGYENDGTTLSDFSILDPWDGWIGNAADGHDYCGEGYDVITID